MVRFSPTDRGWIVGNGGLILCFDFDSDSWSQQVSLTTEDIECVYPADSETVWAAGVFLHFTDDCGGFWQKQYNDNIQGVDLWFSDDGLTGFVASDYYGAFFSTIGGGSALETTMSHSPEGNLRNLVFVDKNNGWGCGDYGTILKYSALSSEVSEDFTESIYPSSSLRVSSNPFTSETSVSFNSSSSFHCELDLYVLYGRRITRIHDGEISGGENTFQISGIELRPGVYFAVLRNDETGSTSVCRVVRVE